MRFMMIVNPSRNWEEGKMPGEPLVTAMNRYNDELRKAGVLIDVAGLHPTSKASRIRFSGGKRMVIDGPFTETKELIGGYWLIEVNSKAEAIEWAMRAPAPHGENEEAQIEIRQVFEFREFGPPTSMEKERET